ncbi:MAG: acetylxylan esterase [Tannerella sp.]|jgi:dienelactone hydrolase|nr:acetylxylan esterase [Tannerella sp.]
MKKFSIIIVLLCTYFFVNAQEDLSVNNYWTYNKDMSNALYEHILGHASAQINERWSYVGGLKTRNDWEIRQAEVKKIMEEMVGKFPLKTPLNPVITGKIKRDGFTVEKLYFESMPGFYVTCALFLPTIKRGKLPAIIYCCGHSSNGFRSDGYQRSIMNLVKKGFIVLAVDPVGQGERIQYFDTSGKNIFGATHEHSYPGSQSFVSGLSPANYFIWDGIRAVDYLISRKEVDPARIGITGRSGGGTQTAYIAAMDDRILAAAPECYITSFDKLLRSKGPQDAEQIFMYSLAKGFDLSDLIEIRAPKPTLMVTTTRDIFSIQGARDVFKEAKNAYIAFDVPGNLMMVEDDAGHESTKKNREAVHAFFQKFLNNPGDPKDEDIILFDEKDLWVTPTGQLQTSLKGETLFSLNEKFTAEVLQKMQLEKQNNPDFNKNIAQKAKSLIGYSEPEPSNDIIFSGRLWRDDCSIEKYLVKGPGNYYIPVLRLSSGENTKKTVLLLDDQGKAAAAAKNGLAEKLVQKGYQVIVPDLNGFGELGGGYKGGDAKIMGVSLNVWYAGILTNKSLLSVRVEEIKLIVDFIKGLGTFESLTGISCGTLSSDLLHSVVINKEFNQIAMINPLFSYKSIVQERNYHPKFVMSALPGVIGKYDLPDLVTAISPLKICFLNPVNALDQMIDRGIFEQAYMDVKKTYNNSQNLTIVYKKPDVFLKLYQWLD